MDKKNKTSSEIEPWEIPAPPTKPAENDLEIQEKLKKITRRSFRGAPEGSDSAIAKVNNKYYEIVNIGSHGIGIALPPVDKESFTVGENCQVTVKLSNEVVISSSGRIMHISQHTDDQHFCGIDLFDLSSAEEQKLQVFIQKKRAKLLDNE